MLGLCADWLPVLGRHPDEVALMQSFLSKASEHHVDVPTLVTQWAVWWHYDWGRVFDWECPALFGNMAQWIATHEAPSWLPSHGSSAVKKYLYLSQNGMYESAAAAAAPALTCVMLCFSCTISFRCNIELWCINGWACDCVAVNHYVPTPSASLPFMGP